MARMIDADALIKHMDECAVNTERSQYATGYAKAFIEDAPTIEPMQWIPCSERLPEKDGRYLVLYDWGDEAYDYIVLNYFPEDTEPWKKGWHNLHDMLDHMTDWDADMVAWMPLPAPYRGGDADGRP